MASVPAGLRDNRDRTAGRKRLTAGERRDSILSAARYAFAKSGDASATTIKQIATAAGISEGIIYRHFDSKDDLFLAAIVEPLEQAILSVVRASHASSRKLTIEGIVDLRQALWRSMLRMIDNMLPLLGLVLFGEPNRARDFYRTAWSTAVDGLASAFAELYPDEPSYPSREVAIACLGIAIGFSLDARYNRSYDAKRTVDTLPRITPAFWPLGAAKAGDEDRPSASTGQ